MIAADPLAYPHSATISQGDSAQVHSGAGGAELGSGCGEMGNGGWSADSVSEVCIMLGSVRDDSTTGRAGANSGRAETKCTNDQPGSAHNTAMRPSAASAAFITAIRFTGCRIAAKPASTATKTTLASSK